MVLFRTGCALLACLIMSPASGAHADALSQSVQQWLQQEIQTHAGAEAEPEAGSDAVKSSAPLELRAVYGVGSRLTAEFFASGQVFVARSDAPRLQGSTTMDETSVALLGVRGPCAKLKQASGALIQACILPREASHE
ncbi:hypothetical protein L499_A2394 [Bordetella holmesii CDC-H635-BH]|nr:putative type IV pilus assembly protein [Bordetella holmesii ATCC 51541]EWM45948.1 putative type IV pilus assembly protein [Bordetella holmesii 70147]KAL02734.1 hypothetical protein L499_A2394 [Bordetella holmesii CDC-H635-BH]